ncbi:hypothetical protein DYB37_003398 [Aphanomyces astaci]|uniref:Sideroflexin n=1 Tax=Aphanomyces astaci TaxID=112090 RepID=A0A418FFY3_APHAT|nr:hypothetical protein DYB35_005876 [Aphanomyces astaci]RHZ28813.1 hypothetical protein DYB37_003398 [Aphanomyces astaci]
MNQRYVSGFLLSDDEIAKSQQLIDNFKTGTLAPGQVPDADLWKARRVVETVFHPQTGEKLPVLFRMPAFVPVNIPICSGMILAPPTVLFCSTLCFGNGSIKATTLDSTTPTATPVVSTTPPPSPVRLVMPIIIPRPNHAILAEAYASAVAISCATSVGLGKAVERASFLAPTVRSVLSKTVPFVAVAAAGAGNAVFMRLSELTDGIDILDDEGVPRGRSQEAGKQSLTQVALTRVALPVPRIVTLCIWGAFPAAIALFPQYGSIPASQVEPQFQHLKNSKGQPITEFTYNKGI